MVSFTVRSEQKSAVSSMKRGLFNVKVIQNCVLPRFVKFSCGQSYAKTCAYENKEKCNLITTNCMLFDNFQM